MRFKTIQNQRPAMKTLNISLPATSCSQTIGGPGNLASCTVLIHCTTRLAVHVYRKQHYTYGPEI
jgi:hypothetical protein